MQEKPCVMQLLLFLVLKKVTTQLNITLLQLKSKKYNNNDFPAKTQIDKPNFKLQSELIAMQLLKIVFR